MLLTRNKFKTFTPKEICDATKSTEILVCLSCESRDKVNEMVRKAVAANGTTYNEPQDHGFMYGHGFQDLDGHICVPPLLPGLLPGRDVRPQLRHQRRLGSGTLALAFHWNGKGPSSYADLDANHRWLPEDSRQMADRSRVRLRSLLIRRRLKPRLLSSYSHLNGKNRNTYHRARANSRPASASYPGRSWAWAKTSAVPVGSCGSAVVSL
jgi:hypothetical protein